MISASFPISFGVSLANDRSFKECRRSRIRSSQERSTNGALKQQEKTMIPETEVAETEVGLPPLVSALKASAEKNTASFHFPGHNRGQAAPSSLTQLIGIKPFIHDFTALPELDRLASPEGPILDAQLNAAQVFGSSETWFLVGGTTCGIQAAIMATCSPGDSLILSRNSHISAISATVLCGALPKYIVPEYNFQWDIAGGVTPSQVEKAIKELKDEGRKAAAVFVTSPTYNGICSNLSEISKLCHSHQIPLIVDEAHGAHFSFHLQLRPNSALKQGADLVVQSTHKVLCSLTQSSMLHMSGNIVDRERICRCLQTLQSTSPSYLLLASPDATTAQLSQNPDTIFNKAVEMAFKTKNMIKKIPGISVLDLSNFSHFPAMDPLRLSVGVWKLGLSGYEADEILGRKFGIVPELIGTRSLTFVITHGSREEHLQRLVYGFRQLSETSILQIHEVEEDRKCAPFADISMGLKPREAFFASKRRVNIGESLGEICGEFICPFPPGIPVMIPGETVTQSALDYLLHVRNKGAIIAGASDPQLSSMLVCNV